MSKSKISMVTMSDKERIWGIVYLLLELLVLPSLLHRANGFLPSPLPDSWLNFLYFSLNFIFVCFLFRHFLKRSLLHTARNIADFLLVTIGGFGVYYLVNTLLGFVIGWIAPGFSNLNDGSIALLAQGNFTVMAVGTAVLVPVAEELLHRGLVFGSLCGKSRTFAYIFSTILFAAIHVMGYIGLYSLPHLLLAFVQYLPAGMVLAWTYRKSGTIFSPILIHAAVNTLAILSLR